MYGGKTVGVVVPAYNEAGLIGETIASIPSFVDRVYVIDDGSTDETWEEIRRVAVETVRSTASGDPSALDGRLVPIRHRENRGVGGAIKTGYLEALDDGLDVVAVMAGDGQMDPAVLESIVEPVASGDVGYAKGNRFLLPETRRNVPRFRLFGNLLLTGLTKVASGYWGIGDSQNGYSAISRDALEAVDVREMFEFYGYCNDLLVKLNAAGVSVADVPAPIIYGEEESDISYRTYVPKVSKLLLGRFLWRLRERYVIRDFHPLVLCYGVGLLGAVLTLVQVALSRTSLSQATTNGLVSVLFLVLGMLQDKGANEHLAEQIDPRGADTPSNVTEMVAPVRE